MKLITTSIFALVSLFFLVSCNQQARQIAYTSTPQEVWTITSVIADTPIPSNTPKEGQQTAVARIRATKTARATLTPPTSTVTPSKTFTSSKIFTPSVTHQPTPTPTLTPTTTPTFDVARIVTRTSAPPAQCPAENSALVPNYEYSIFTSESVTKFYGQILDFLNAGGTRNAVIVAYLQHDPKAGERIIREVDVTGDSVPELLLTDSDSSVAYICQDGQYQLVDVLRGTYHYYQPIIVDIKDMNLDGVHEIILGWGDERVRSFSVFEWEIDHFQMLNPTCADIYGPSSVDIIDTDHNGTLELILNQAIPIWSEYIMGIPWREGTRTCTWNGKLFEVTRTEYAPPEYRFQAVQDGDRATLQGEYDKALDLYQQAIFSDKLDWWSAERRYFEFNAYAEEGIYKPASDPSMYDPAEYPNLAAYSRFRIMLLHVKQGFILDAKTVYDTLGEKFPPGQIGYSYTEMAAAFWNEYGLSQSMRDACEKAIQYAAQNPADVLAYLGNGEYANVFYGAQSLEYVPEDMCPFR